MIKQEQIKISHPLPSTPKRLPEGDAFIWIWDWIDRFNRIKYILTTKRNLRDQ